MTEYDFKPTEGAHVVLAYTDRHDVQIPFIVREYDGAPGKIFLGLFGGFAENKDKTRAHTAVREVGEELVLPDKTPLIKLDPAKLKLLTTKEDDRKPDMPITAYGFCTELNWDDFVKIKGYAKALENPDVRQALKEASGNEVLGIRILPLKEAVKLEPSQFAHPHELETVKAFAQYVAQRHTVAL